MQFLLFRLGYIEIIIRVKIYKIRLDRRKEEKNCKGSSETIQNARMQILCRTNMNTAAQPSRPPCFQSTTKCLALHHIRHQPVRHPPGGKPILTKVAQPPNRALYTNEIVKNASKTITSIELLEEAIKYLQSPWISLILSTANPFDIMWLARTFVKWDTFHKIFVEQ